MTMVAFFGRFYDGRSSMPVPVAMHFERHALVIVAPEFERRIDAGRYEMPERTEHGQPILRIRGGQLVEIDDVGALWRAAAEAGIHERLVSRIQQRWSLSMLALLIALAALFAGYRWGLPRAAELLAPHLPAGIETRLGREALAWLDTDTTRPSNLSASRQSDLRDRLAAMISAAHGQAEPVPWDLAFRASEEIGANAFALPGGTIVVTDELAQMASDEALLGVLAHEYGHIRRHHLIRRLLQVSALGAVAATLWGDFSGMAATVPVVLGGLDYSRELEREADGEAVRILLANGMTVEPLIALFMRLEQPAHDAGAADRLPANPRSGVVERYLSSHPLTRERVQALRDAAAN